MDKFLVAMLKTSCLILAFMGVLVLCLGLALLFYPNVLMQVIRWGGITVFIIGGAALMVGALYGYMATRKRGL